MPKKALSIVFRTVLICGAKLTQEGYITTNRFHSSVGQGYLSDKHVDSSWHKLAIGSSVPASPISIGGQVLCFKQQLSPSIEYPKEIDLLYLVAAVEPELSIGSIPAGPKGGRCVYLQLPVDE